MSVARQGCPHVPRKAEEKACCRKRAGVPCLFVSSRKVIAPGSRATHILPGIRDGKITGDALCVATLPSLSRLRDRRRPRREMPPRGSERPVSEKTRRVRIPWQEVDPSSIYASTFLLSFLRRPPRPLCPLEGPLTFENTSPGPPACVKVYS